MVIQLFDPTQGRETSLAVFSVQLVAEVTSAFFFYSETACPQFCSGALSPYNLSRSPSRGANGILLIGVVEGNRVSNP